MGRGMKGDFIGFKLGDKHSSDMGITRVSEGDRYEESLSGTISDSTVTVPGSDGTYYFGSQYNSKVIPISCAFDNLNEKQFRELQGWLQNKTLRRLIFDDRPFKYYMAKINDTPSIKYIPFTVDGERIYKGELEIEFIAYYPYAKSVNKYMDEYTEENPEWAAAAGLKETKGDYDGEDSNSIQVVNCGDLDCNIKIYLSSLQNCTIALEKDGEQIKNLTFSNIGDTISLAEGEQICIDSRTNLVIDNSNKLYNKFITSGDFFKIPADGEDYNITISAGTIDSIEYEYIYY